MTNEWDEGRCLLASESFVEDIYLSLFDDVLFGLLLQVHRSARLGYLFYLDPDADPEFDKQYEIYEENDVLGAFSHLNENFKVSTGGRSGQSSGSNNNLVKYECVCPNCDRNVAAIRFAPHLEKCMGMGRNSSRIATRRIANYIGDDLDQLIESSGLITTNPTITTTTTTSTNSREAKNQEDDLMSIINAVATAGCSLPVSNNGSTSSMIDVDISSNSSSSSSNLKPPNAKKKRMQSSKSAGASSSSSLSFNNNINTSNSQPSNLQKHSSLQTNTSSNLNNQTNPKSTFF